MIGDPAHAGVLMALGTVPHATAEALAEELGRPQRRVLAALARLQRAGLIVASGARSPQYRLAGPDVRQALTSLALLSERMAQAEVSAGTEALLQHARVCHTHLAGEMGTRMYRSLLLRGVLRRQDGGLELTEAGRDFAEGFGIDLRDLSWGRALLCQPCLDWSARHNHLAGGLGRAFLSRFLDLRWVERVPESAALRFSAIGEERFRAAFPVPG